MLTLKKTLTVVLVLTVSAVAQANSNVYKQLVKSTAMIVTSEGHGSGALIDTERKLVFTNYHVVGEETEVSVVFPRYEDGELMTNRSSVLRELDRFAVAGKVVARDMKRDLVLIEIDSIPEGIEPVKLAEAAASPGETVHAIGNPSAVDAMWAYTSGKVRQLFRTEYTLSEGTQPVKTRVVETDLAINPGDSGGPVVNDNCEVVAVVSAFSTKSRLVSSCIDARELRALLEGNNSTIDNDIANALEEAGLEYTTNPYGVFFIQVPAYDDELIEVRISGVVHEHRGRRLRQIRALFIAQEEAFTGDTAIMLMSKNGERKFGAWEFVKIEESHCLFYRADVNEDADAEELVSAVRGVADSTRGLVVELNEKSTETETPKDTPLVESTPKNPSAPLLGVWNGEGTNDNGQTVGHAIRFDSDGTIHWFIAEAGKEVVSVEGDFTFDGDTLKFNLNDNEFETKLQIVDNNSFVYTNNSTTLTFSRYNQPTDTQVSSLAGK